ncbi:eukaryotic translation initiation factor 4 gamma 3-like isoform X2 [Daphnia pulex]|uniref:eukaryotic translation initiation factor 4 gamma 3-like isoform X2 n=1 Tax=Daphnia pulex TaxID=6669 RepID=UPI001EDCE98B|nr:eukaryotic translation initiation factor 4 gamma 3-like isoform X2 [Daphnia pulex]
MAIPFSLGSLPANLKKMEQYLDIASDYESIDCAVSYWCRLYALQQGFILQKGKEDLDYLLDLMEWLGLKKEELKSLKTVSDLLEARIHLENVVLKFINWAETAFNLFPFNQYKKIVLGAFSSARTLLDVCSVFGELSEEMASKKKYVDLHLASMKTGQYLFSSEVTTGQTTEVVQDLSSQEQWSPEGKKIYDRVFLLELRNNPASQILPEKLINEEITRGSPEDVSNNSPERLIFPKISQPKKFSNKEPLKSNRIVRKRSEENLRKPENRFKLREKKDMYIPDGVGIEEYLKHVVKILNELTPLTFERTLPKFKALNLNTEERLLRVSQLIYEKALEEPNLSLMYAKTCQSLSLKKAECDSNSTETPNFRSMLMDRCLSEFDKTSTGQYDVENKKKEIDCAETEAKKAEMEMELIELQNNRRKYAFANIRFMGELYKIKVVPLRFVHECIVWLLSQDRDEEALECLCFLLISIGKDLEVPNKKPNPNPKNMEMMTTYLNNLMVIGNKAEISDRIRSLIRGVIDLRNIGWLSHENSNVVQANEVPNKREGHSNGHQLPQDISVSNGICRDVVDDKGESGDVNDSIDSEGSNLLEKEKLKASEDSPVVTMAGIGEDLSSLILGALNEAPELIVENGVVASETFLIRL